MKKDLGKIIVFMFACGWAPITYAAEYSHTAHTSFCPHQRLAVGTCVSSHSGGFADAINLKCLLKRGGATIASNLFSEYDLETGSQFNLSASGALVANRNYCTRNQSQYLVDTLFGLSVIVNQGNTAQHCKFYSVAGTGR